MSDVQTQFEHLCQQWQELTRAEARAIQAGNWAAVEQCQLAKTQLQPKLMAATDALRQAAAQQGRARQTEQHIQQLVGHLLSLERQNEAALAAQYDRVRQQQADLAQAAQTLRQLRRAYGGSAPATWQRWS
jgi:hypothetical protein